MSLVKYKILEAPIENSEVEVPEKAIPLGVLTIKTPPAGEPAQDATLPYILQYGVSLVLIMRYQDWVAEFPEQAAKEITEHIKNARMADTNGK